MLARVLLYIYDEYTDVRKFVLNITYSISQKIIDAEGKEKACFSYETSTLYSVQTRLHIGVRKT